MPFTFSVRGTIGRRCGDGVVGEGSSRARASSSSRTDLATGRSRCCATRSRSRRPQARLDQRGGRVPQRGRHLHRMHDARVPDKFMPFMDEPPGSRVSATASTAYGAVIRRLRGITAKTVDKEPRWRVKGSTLPPGTPPGPGRRRGRNDDDHDTEPADVGAAGGHRRRRDGLGPDHPDRRQPRHLREDRLHSKGGPGVPQHVLDLPRLQHLHEGQGPARRALHHQPHLRHLR